MIDLSLKPDLNNKVTVAMTLDMGQLDALRESLGRNMMRMCKRLQEDFAPVWDALHKYQEDHGE